METIDWLLDSDPAIRWQALRDLADGSAAEIAAERARVPKMGIGAHILGCQGTDGAWHRPDTRDWLPTVFTMQLLRATGADPEDQAVAAAVDRLAKGFRWHEQVGGKLFFEGETEPCLNGGTLALGAYFGRLEKSLVQRLLGEQLADGGWNCDAPPSTCASFNTTICVLEGLWEYERALGSAPEITAARKRGEEYLLPRFLFRRRSTGEVASPDFLKLAYPPRYYYDVLRGLDHLRATGFKPDARLDEAIRLVRDRRQSDGRWLLEESYTESLALPFPEKTGEPSRWITLRALRVLRWFEQQ